MRRLELTNAAEIDLAEIFDRSVKAFGTRARRRYENLIETAFADLMSDPVRIGSVRRPELGADLRTYHLRHSRTGHRLKGALVGRPRHLVAYEFDDRRLLVLRVLHDAMDLARHTGDGEPSW